MILFLDCWVGVGCQLGWAHCGAKLPNGNRVPGGTHSTCKSKNLARSCNTSAGGLGQVCTKTQNSASCEGVLPLHSRIVSTRGHTLCAKRTQLTPTLSQSEQPLALANQRNPNSEPIRGTQTLSQSEKPQLSANQRNPIPTPIRETLTLSRSEKTQP